MREDATPKPGLQDDPPLRKGLEDTDEKDRLRKGLQDVPPPPPPGGLVDPPAPVRQQ